MFKIKIINTIAAVGLNQFPPELYEVSPHIEDPDGILVRSQNLHNIEFSERLKVIGRAGAGVNNIPVSALTQRGIPVLNTPGANANAVRELVLAGMLLASRHICAAWNYLGLLDKNNDDAALNKHIEQDKKQFVGFELMGKTLGVIGLGNVGVKVANAAISLGMRVLGFDPEISVYRAWELSSEVKQASHLEELLKTADFISVHVPLMPETKHMINQSRITLFKTGAVLLNFAREEIVDTVALADALHEKKILAYVTDFPCASLRHFPQVISLPHLGASTKEAEDNCAIMIVKGVRDFFENGSISNSINFPSLSMPRTNMARRLAIVNYNIPNMVAKISSLLGDAGINIISLMNKSKEEIAYTLIDINMDITPILLKKLTEIQGVLQVRTL